MRYTSQYCIRPKSITVPGCCRRGRRDCEPWSSSDLELNRVRESGGMLRKTFYLGLGIGGSGPVGGADTVRDCTNDEEKM